MELFLVVLTLKFEHHSCLPCILCAFEWVEVTYEYGDVHCPGDCLQPLCKVGCETSAIEERPGVDVILLDPLYLYIDPLLSIPDVYSDIHSHVPFAIIHVGHEILYSDLHVIEVGDIDPCKYGKGVCSVLLLFEETNHGKVEEVEVFYRCLDFDCCILIVFMIFFLQ